MFHTIRYIIIFLLFCLQTLSVIAQKSVTLYHLGSVVGTYATIKEAISNLRYCASPPYDSIVLSPHIFYEHDIIARGGEFIIKGSSVNASRIDAEGKGRIFDFTGSRVTIEDVTMENGYTMGNGGGIYYDNSSGFYMPILTLRGNTILRNCYAKGNGGGIYYPMKLFMQGNAKVTNNRSDSMAGGIAAFNLICSGNPEISYNQAKYGGAGYINDYHVVINNLRILNNYASEYSGAFIGLPTMNNVIIKDNKAGKGYNSTVFVYNIFETPGPTPPGSFVLASNSYIYNPDSNGRRNYEILGANDPLFYVYHPNPLLSNWYGNSDTTGVIEMDPSKRSSAIPNYVVAKWQLNRGKPLAPKDTLFPLQAGFRLNTGAALSPGACRWLSGHFKATGGGAFLDSMSSINSKDTVESYYRSFIAPPY